jgi:poly(3-hydroxybutyrate) depolymerase
MKQHFYKTAFALAVFSLITPACAQESSSEPSRFSRFKQVLETQRANKASVVSEESLGAFTKNMQTDQYKDRDMMIYVPSTLPDPANRKMLVVLHGGGGNAQFMVDHLKIDGVAERNHFIVAYLNGSAAATIGRKLKAWNAGKGCCGKPYTDKVDDIGYITGAVNYLQQKYNVSTSNTFGAGHSNGAIMTQTLMCIVGLYPKGATLAGTLMAEVNTCPAATGRTIYNYHGEDDINLPIAGGFGTKGVTNIDFTSQAYSKEMFEKSGGRYVLQIFDNTDHHMEHLSLASQKLNGMTIGERIAHDLGLLAR